MKDIIDFCKWVFSGFGRGRKDDRFDMIALTSKWQVMAEFLEQRMDKLQEQCDECQREAAKCKIEAAECKALRAKDHIIILRLESEIEHLREELR